MKKNTIVKIILLFLILIVTFLIIRSTYSKYITAKDDNTFTHIANWNIKLNNKNIEENRDFTETMDLVFDDNDYIDDDVIAPTSSGSFNVNIESTGTELPYIYTLNLDKNSNFDISVTDYIMNRTDSTTSIKFTLTLDFSYYENFSSLSSATIKLNIPTESLANYTISNSSNIQLLSRDTISFNVANIRNSPYKFDFDLKYNKILDLSSKKIVSNIYINDIPFEYRNNDLVDFNVVSYELNGGTSENIDLPYLIELVYPGTSLSDIVKRDYKFYFGWNDTPSNLLDNYNDVKASKISIPKATLPLNLSIVQIIEEN